MADEKDQIKSVAVRLDDIAEKLVQAKERKEIFDLTDKMSDYLHSEKDNFSEVVKDIVMCDIFPVIVDKIAKGRRLDVPAAYDGKK